MIYHIFVKKKKQPVEDKPQITKENQEYTPLEKNINKIAEEKNIEIKDIEDANNNEQTNSYKPPFSIDNKI